MRKLISLLTVFIFSLTVYAGMSNSIEYSQLYIVGTAVKGGWNIGATPMNKIDRGVFTWTGTLTANEPFKFMNSNDGWHKHIVATTKDELIKEDEVHHLDFYANWQLADMLDNKFRVEKTGEYVLTVDLRNMSVCMSKPLPAASYPEKYYATGSALDNQVIELAKIENFEFKQSLRCKAGNVILMDTPVIGEDTRYFIPVFEDVDLTYGKGFESKLRVTTDAEVRGWSVSVPGDYNIYISCSDNRYIGRMHKHRKYLFITGGCCEIAWDYSDQSHCDFAPNPENPDELIWEGELRIGWNNAPEPNRFKILTERSWSEDNYHPYIADTPAEGTVNIRTTDGEDSKWTIKRSGQYRITVNTRTETMTTEFLSSEPTSTGNGGDDTAGIESTESGGVGLSWVGNQIELLYASDPVDVKVVDVAGNVMASKDGITKGIVAGGLTSGVYLVSVIGKSINKLYKVAI